MANILQTMEWCFVNDNTWMGIPLKYAAKGPVDKKSSLTLVIAWRGNNLLPEPIMTQLTGVCIVLGLCPANERGRYFVTTSLIGWAQA